eukprot:gene7934-biopygen9116
MEGGADIHRDPLAYQDWIFPVCPYVHPSAILILMDFDLAGHGTRSRVCADRITYFGRGGHGMTIRCVAAQKTTSADTGRVARSSGDGGGGRSGRDATSCSRRCARWCGPRRKNGDRTHRPDRNNAYSHFPSLSRTILPSKGSARPAPPSRGAGLAPVRLPLAEILHGWEFAGAGTRYVQEFPGNPEMFAKHGDPREFGFYPRGHRRCIRCPSYFTELFGDCGPLTVAHLAVARTVVLLHMCIVLLQFCPLTVAHLPVARTVVFRQLLHRTENTEIQSFGATEQFGDPPNSSVFYCVSTRASHLGGGGSGRGAAGGGGWGSGQRKQGFQHKSETFARHLVFLNLVCGTSLHPPSFGGREQRLRDRCAVRGGEAGRVPARQIGNPPPIHPPARLGWEEPDGGGSCCPATGNVARCTMCIGRQTLPAETFPRRPLLPGKVKAISHRTMCPCRGWLPCEPPLQPPLSVEPHKGGGGLRFRTPRALLFSVMHRGTAHRHTTTQMHRHAAAQRTDTQHRHTAAQTHSNTDAQMHNGTTHISTDAQTHSGTDAQTQRHSGTHTESSASACAIRTRTGRGPHDRFQRNGRRRTWARFFEGMVTSHRSGSTVLHPRRRSLDQEMCTPAHRLLASTLQEMPLCSLGFPAEPHADERSRMTTCRRGAHVLLPGRSEDQMRGVDPLRRRNTLRRAGAARAAAARAALGRRHWAARTLQIHGGGGDPRNATLKSSST